MSANDEVLLGSNRILIKDDVLTWICGPVVRVQDAEAGHALFSSQNDKYGYVLVLGDIRQLSALPAEIRRLHSEWHRRYNPHFSVALFGGSFVARALAQLVFRAAELIQGRGLMQFKWSDSESHAIAWLDSERIRLRQKLPGAAKKYPPP